MSPPRIPLTGLTLSPTRLPHLDTLPQESPPTLKKVTPTVGVSRPKIPETGSPPVPPPRGGKITPTVRGIRGGDLSPLDHFPVRVIFGVLGVITPTLGVDVHPYTIYISTVTDGFYAAAGGQTDREETLYLLFHHYNILISPQGLLIQF